MGVFGGDPGEVWGSGGCPTALLIPGLLQAVQGGRVKRYSSQRQRPPVPEPAPPMHISIMEGHYYDPRECFPPAPVVPCVLRTEQLEQGSPHSCWSQDFVFSFLCCSGTVSPHAMSKRQLGASLVVFKPMELSSVLSPLYARALRTPQFFPRTGI